MDAELDSFKNHISVADVAINHFGYAVDKKESCRSSTVLRSDSGDKLVVMRHKVHGHDTYFGRQEADRGSVVDFVNFRVVSNDARLIPVRQLLRQYVPGAKKPAARKVPVQAILDMKPVVIEKDPAKIKAYLNTIPDYTGAYLTETRGLDQATIDRFPVGLGMYGHAVFAHKSVDREFCGYEYKNKPKAGETKSVTGFAEGGQKGLFIGCPDGSDAIERIVIAEAAIDVISFYQLNPETNTLYLSTAGTKISSIQEDQLRDLLGLFPSATLVLAMDNDVTDKHGNAVEFNERPGEVMAKDIASLAPFGMKTVRATPTLKDWNADLLAKRDQAQLAVSATL